MVSRMTIFSASAPPRRAQFQHLRHAAAIVAPPSALADQVKTTAFFDQDPIIQRPPGSVSLSQQYLFAFQNPHLGPQRAVVLQHRFDLRCQPRPHPHRSERHGSRIRRNKPDQRHRLKSQQRIILLIDDSGETQHEPAAFLWGVPSSISKSAEVKLNCLQIETNHLPVL